MIMPTVPMIITTITITITITTRLFASFCGRVRVGLAIFIIARIIVIVAVVVVVVAVVVFD